MVSRVAQNTGFRYRPELWVPGVARTFGFTESPKILGVTRNDRNAEFRVTQGTWGEFGNPLFLVTPETRNDCMNPEISSLREPGVPADSGNP